MIFMPPPKLGLLGGVGWLVGSGLLLAGGFC
jgi:hypothetical protein